jgi:hypothetical protein
MAIECSYSFKDLYRAAHGGKEPKAGELRLLYALSQQERNRIVMDWARMAAWQTKERKGSDGISYLAFAPSFGEENPCGAPPFINLKITNSKTDAGICG